MSLFFRNRDGQTTIDENMRDELIPSHVQDMTELYELESENIALGMDWSAGTRKAHTSVETWLEFKSLPPQEMMAILHERLLTIHPFRDGNGRWARVLIQFVSAREGFEKPNWGTHLLDDEERRMAYIDAVKVARTAGNYQLLIEFMYGQ